jgi:hypothetical protein
LYIASACMHVTCAGGAHGSAAETAAEAGVTAGGGEPAAAAAAAAGLTIDIHVWFSCPLVSKAGLQQLQHWAAGVLLTNKVWAGPQAGVAAG